MQEKLDALNKKKTTVSVTITDKNLIQALRTITAPQEKTIPDFIHDKLLPVYMASLDEETQKKVLDQAKLMNNISSAKL